MILTLIKSEHITTTTLPEKVSGQYWVQDLDDNNIPFDLICIEGIEGSWYIKSCPNAWLVDSNGSRISHTKVVKNNFYELQINGYYGKVVLFAELITNDRNKFTKYSVMPNATINIGRAKSNELIFDNQVVSSVHATLEYNNGLWSITDQNSTNGTFVNGIGVDGSTKLTLGDIVYIMGLKIVIGNDFIAVNNPDGQVSVLSNKFLPFRKMARTMISNEENHKKEKSLLYRPPRFKREIKPALIKVDAPPNNQIGEEMPMLLMIGPSATMGMAALTTGIFAVNNAIVNGNITSAIPSAVMSLSMLLGTVLWPIISKKYDKKRRRKKEAYRQKKYSEYLERVNNLLDEECEKQSEILHENIITIGECSKRIKTASNKLWERNSSHNDFLTVRLGIGTVPLYAEIKYPERRFNLEDDNLLEEMYKLCETQKMLNDVPIVFSITDNYVSGIYGNTDVCNAFIKGLILQISAQVGYDDVKFVFLYEDKCFDFVRWFPHSWDNNGKIHLIATNLTEVKEVSAYLDKIISNRVLLDETALNKCAPYYIIFNLSSTLSSKSETLKQLYRQEKNINMSVINLCQEMKQLPKECSSIIEIREQQGFVFDKDNVSGKPTEFKPDALVSGNPRELSVKLANTFIDDPESSKAFPQLVAFLDMYNVGKVEHLNALTRWKENDPTKSLQAPIGVNSYGDIFYLDLHEKFHGPHGLVAGMTGSGKSEFIITYILSLALNYSPEEVAFILIDYKGGGMAKAFESLPHVAGIITNLDGAAIKRSLVSIESELKYRQALFAEASKKLGISNIDIYKYQKAYRDGLVHEPLPHLFIISDEFAELKTQQQEFMTQLISAARIGRSLGVHLILATQKPSGVVDDQIWSNSRFRVCLKVQERSDSMDMLKRADAAELSDTGRFYLQVGYNELFDIGQSAWAGAPYYPTDGLTKNKELAVDVLDNNGHIIQSAKLSNKNLVTNPKKQLDAITNYLNSISINENLKAKPLWLEPIAPVIYLEDIRDKYSITNKKYVLNPVVGEYDIPAMQNRNVLSVPITDEGNVIVYGTNGSGKTTFVSTLIYDLITTHTADELNLYILDFASETLKAFEKAPHVGDVILSFEAEKIINLFKMLKSEIINRKKLFSDFGGEYITFCTDSENKVPNILVVINNYAVFSELYEACEEDVMYLSREGSKYGVHFVLTAVSANSVRYKMLQNFAQTYVLQMNDEMDYSGILGNVDGVYPSKFKGRGIIKKDAVYEFQTAYCSEPDKMYEQIRTICTELQKNGRVFANCVPVLPQKVDATFLENHKNSIESTPIGVNKSNLQIVSADFSEECISIISSLDQKYLLRFSQGIAEILSRNIGVDTMVFDFEKTYALSGFENYKYVSEDAEKSIVELFNLMVERHKQFKENYQIKFSKHIYIFPSFSIMSKYLSADGIDKLNVLLDKSTSDYEMYFIICDISSELQKLSMQPWFRNHCGKGNGIWVGDGVTNQYQLKISSVSSELNREIGGDFGIVINNGKYKICKLVQPEFLLEEEDKNG